MINGFLEQNFNVLSEDLLAVRLNRDSDKYNKYVV